MTFRTFALLLREKLYPGEFEEDSQPVSPSSFWFRFRMVKALFDINLEITPHPVEIELSHFCCRWADHHMPVFRPSEQLAAALALTDVDALLTSEVRLPFPVFVVEIPLGWRSAKGTPVAYVVLHDHLVLPQNAISEKDLVSALENFGKGDEGPVANIAAMERRSLFFGLFSSDPHADPIAFVSGATPRPDETVGEWFPADITPEVLYYEDPPPQVTAKQEEHAQWLARVGRNLSFGLAVYITEKGRGRKLPQPPLSKKVKQRAAKRGVPSARRDFPSVYILGEDIQVDSALISAAKTAGSDEPGWRIRRRFVVRGHMRNQACGPNHSERRFVWVRPYWKGPAEGERLIHVYDAGERAIDLDAGKPQGR